MLGISLPLSRLVGRSRFRGFTGPLTSTAEVVGSDVSGTYPKTFSVTLGSDVDQIICQINNRTKTLPSKVEIGGKEARLLRADTVFARTRGLYAANVSNGNVDIVVYGDKLRLLDRMDCVAVGVKKGIVFGPVDFDLTEGGNNSGPTDFTVGPVSWIADTNIVIGEVINANVGNGPTGFLTELDNNGRVPTRVHYGVPSSDATDEQLTYGVGRSGSFKIVTGVYDRADSNAVLPVAPGHEWVWGLLPGEDTYDMPVKCAYTGTAPSTIEARILDTSDTLVLDWTEISVSPSSGFLEGIFTNVPRGGPYWLETRRSNGSIESRCGQLQSVGYRILLYGQSNANKMLNEPLTGQPDAPDPTEGSSLYSNRPDAFANGGFTSIPETRPGYTDPPAYGLRGFYDELYALIGAPVVITCSAIPSANINILSKGSTATSGYGDSISQMADLDDRFAAMLWFQGEANAPFDGAGDASGYDISLKSLLDDFRADATPEMILITASLATINDSRYNAAVVDAELRQAANDDSRITYGGSSKDLTLVDKFHYDPAGYEKRGRLAARTLVHALNLPSGSPAPNPNFFFTSSDVSKNSNTETDINVTHGLDDDFTPGSGGFEISDDDFSTTISISSVTRVDANTLRITHGSTGGSNYKVGYQRQNGVATNLTTDNGALSMPLDGPEESPVTV